ncbi:4'-phosphopantetheinyl transferase superfamily protein [Variovorax humicola]|uniref:4'-phosphopantetheinyl transferase superfamily protein n=1 Tax=Variovorax humicola TaxID=1769758 RepID=A0ABU8VS38_9BURK
MSITALPAVLHSALWRVDLDSAPGAHAVAALSAEETARAQRFVFARDRARYIAAHAALRQTLAGPAHRHAAELAFTTGRFGKPALSASPKLHFNLSHSLGVGLIGLGEDAAIGVDVEIVRPMNDAILLAEQQFDAAERAALAALEPGPARDLAFLRCWTRKEACLKAVGTGLGFDTRRFHVGIDATPCEVTLALEEGAVRVALAPIEIGPGEVAAIAKVMAMHPDARLEAEVCA